MIRFWFGIGLLLALLAGSIGVCLGIVPFHEKGADILDEAARLALQGNWTEAIAKTAVLDKQWQQKQHLTAAFVDHEPLEEANALFAELALMTPEQAWEFSAVCVHLAQTFRAIAEPLDLKWWSLL